MQTLLQDMKKNEYKQCYLLHGEEAYLRLQYKEKLKEALVSPEDTMNYHYFEGKNINAREIIDLAETLPFFAARRVIIMENTGWLKEKGDVITDYIGEICSTTVIVFVEEQVDKRTGLYKAIKKHGRVSEFKKQEEATLKKWILSMLGKEGKKITASSMDFLLDRVGTDMAYIKTEVEKLICYTGEREEITLRDIDTICVKRVQNQIFEMIAAIGERNRKKALELYYDLLTLKEPPMRILALIGRQFNLLLQVKELGKKGYPIAVIAEKTGLPSFVAGKYQNQSKWYKTRELKQALEDCVQADEDVKNGKMNDRLSVEILICKYSAKAEE